MEWFFLLPFLTGGAPEAVATTERPSSSAPTAITKTLESPPESCWNCPCGNGERAFLASDRAFPGFIGPISNPILSKDPRALTEARPLFVNNWIPRQHPLGGGDFQVYGLQVRAALTDRLSFVADKDGYAVIDPGTGPKQDGWLNVNVGLKYALIRDVDNQFLFTVGLT